MNRRRFVGSLVAAAALGSTAFAVDGRRAALARGGGAAVGSYRPNDLTSAQLVWRVRTSQQIAALTFDDGPDPLYTPQILEVLANHNALATFFMQGAHVVQHPDLARSVAQRHAIGNHTYTHPDMSQSDAIKARDELHGAHRAIERIVGQAPTVFRPPYGHFSGATSMMAAGLGYDVVLWSDRIDSRATVRQNLDRLDSSIKPGAIVLAHDGGPLPNDTVIEVLPHVLALFSRKGIRLVTIPELLRAGQAEITNQPSTT